MIYIFKTNVNSKEDISKIEPKIEKIGSINQWNFDLEDCDKILRIDSTNVVPQAITNLLNTLGFECEELEY